MATEKSAPGGTASPQWKQRSPCVACASAAVVTAEAFDYLDAPPARVHQADVPLPYAGNLEKLSLPGVEDIVKAAKAVCYAE